MARRKKAEDATGKRSGGCARILKYGLGVIVALFGCGLIAQLLPDTPAATPAPTTEIPMPAPQAAQAEPVADTPIPTNTAGAVLIIPPSPSATSTPAPDTATPTTEASRAEELPAIPPTDTATATPIPPTATDIPATATATETATATPVPTATSTPQPAANGNANLRGGPGTNYPVVGSVTAGQALAITAVDPTGEWYQLEDGTWIAGFLVDDASGVVLVGSTPTPQSDNNLSTVASRGLGDSNRDVPRVVKAEQSLDVINIEWTINDSLTDNMVRTGARMDAAKILVALHDSGISSDLVNLVGTFPLIDVYGNTSESPVLWLTFTGETMGRINWSDRSFVEHVLYQRIDDIADTVNIHPAFRAQ